MSSLCSPATPFDPIALPARSAPLIPVLDFAQRYTAAIPWRDLATERATLQATHAFLDSKDAEDNGIRLLMPGHA